MTTPMWAREIKLRTERHDARRVDVIVREVVVTFDVVKIHRLGNARQLVEIEQKTVEVRVINDATDAAI